MADRALLERALAAHFKTSGPPATKGRDLAEAYIKYALTTRSCAGIGPSSIGLDPKKALFAKALGIAFATGFEPTTTLNGVAAAFAAFWLLPGPVVFLASPPGAVVTALPQPLYTALLGVNTAMTALATAGQGPAPEQVAARWAQVLDLWTTTSVVASHGPPPACTGPLT